MSALRVAALVFGEPGPLELWTLRAAAASGCALSVLSADPASAGSARDRALSLLRSQGPLRALSRAAGSVIARREAARDRAVLDELLDLDDLRAWRERSGLRPITVSGHNAPDCLRALDALSPDVLLRVSGGVLKPETLGRARLAALNLHHGLAPRIRGMWSIPWALVEGRADWIGATIHVMDAGIDTGPVLWRGAPQLAPGDTGVQLLFRSHLLACEALTRLLEAYARGAPPAPAPRAADEPSEYRSAAGLLGWLRLLARGRGLRARVLLERGFEC